MLFSQTWQYQITFRLAKIYFPNLNNKYPIVMFNVRNDDV